jgi:hypothetical protein
MPPRSMHSRLRVSVEELSGGKGRTLAAFYILELLFMKLA